ncbi:hypothetical protein THZG08_410028 [Vibrio owensii]|nr:hypothetical protein THZG08_410028 [Vibrio owensii]CAH1578163.1 hypothetical protein THOA03_410028 [Vibrio owensii]
MIYKSLNLTGLNNQKAYFDSHGKKEGNNKFCYSKLALINVWFGLLESSELKINIQIFS